MFTFIIDLAKKLAKNYKQRPADGIGRTVSERPYRNAIAQNVISKVPISQAVPPRLYLIGCTLPRLHLTGCISHRLQFRRVHLQMYLTRCDRQ